MIVGRRLFVLAAGTVVVTLGLVTGAAIAAWPEHGAHVFLSYVAQGFALCF